VLHELEYILSAEYILKS